MAGVGQTSLKGCNQSLFYPFQSPYGGRGRSDGSNKMVYSHRIAVFQSPYGGRGRSDWKYGTRQCAILSFNHLAVAGVGQTSGEIVATLCSEKTCFNHLTVARVLQTCVGFNRN